MRNFSATMLCVFVFSLMFAQSVTAQKPVLVVKGAWGKEVNQLGINLPALGVMPIAPYNCIGGYDVDASGEIWLSDSINGQLKLYKNKQWSYILLNYGKLGDLACFGKRIYVVTREPDGVAIINPETGKPEKHIRIEFKNPGRLTVISDKVLLVEEPGTGLWVCKDEKAALHPAASLEAIGTGKRLFGVQFNLENDSRTVISAELSDEVQEPETLGLYEAGEKILFCKMAGIVDEKPVIMTITQSAPATIKFIKFGDNFGLEKQLELEVLDGPFLHTNWKLCSDGNLYGFAGNASEGFKIYRSEHHL